MTSLAWAVYRKPTCIVRWLVLTAFAAVAVWCSYPAVFVAGGAGLLLTVVLARHRSGAVLAGWLAYGLALCVSFAQMNRIYAAPHAEAAAKVSEISMWSRTYPPIEEPWMLPIWFLETHTGNMLAYPVGAKNGGSSATALLVLVGVVTLWRTRRRDLLLMLLSPLLLNFIAAAMHKYPYGGTVRTMMYAAPAICLLAGLGLAVALRWVGTTLRAKIPFAYNRFAVPAVCLAFAAVAGANIVRDVVEPFKKDANYEARRTVHWLAGQAKPGDQVIAFHAQSPDITYAPYVAPWRGDGAQFIYYMTRDMKANVQWAPPAATIQPAGSGRTWLVVYAGEEFRFKHEEYRKLDRTYGGTHGTFDEMLKAYRAVIDPRLGEPKHHPFSLQTRRGIVGYQAIDIYEYSR